MKKLLLTAVAVLASLNLFAQGTVDFKNGTTSRVFIDAVGGTAAGAGYQVGLYYAPDGVTEESAFTMLGNPANLTSGIFVGGTRTAPTATPGGFANFQVRGWTTAFGANYETGLAAGGQAGNRVGKSSIIRIDTANPLTTPAPETPVLLTGLNAFALTPVPEPSAIALGLVGAGALLMLRRRK